MTPDYSPMFKKWYNVSLNPAPTDGTLFMGRITGTNKAMAVKYDGETQQFFQAQQPYHPVDICQWISFTDFADIRSCVWMAK